MISIQPSANGSASEIGGFGAARDGCDPFNTFPSVATAAIDSTVTQTTAHPFDSMTPPLIKCAYCDGKTSAFILWEAVKP